MKTIELGHGDKLVTDIHNPDEGWAGFCVSDGDCPVGKIADTGAKVDSDLDPELRIITSNPLSLDVIISACERAKGFLGAEDYRSRLIKESSDLSVRLGKLRKFINGKEFKTINQEDRLLLNKQERAMTAYHDVLEERLAGC